jgi:hypothetical protein
MHQKKDTHGCLDQQHAMLVTLLPAQLDAQHNPQADNATVPGVQNASAIRVNQLLECLRQHHKAGCQLQW